MESFKSTLISIALLAAVGALGYWAFTHLQSGSDFALKQQVQDLQNQNASLQKQVSDLTDQLAEAQSNAQVQAQKDAAVAQANQNSAPSSTPSSSSAPSSSSSGSSTYKYQSLINSLQSLADSGVTMKLKEGDAGVGYVQQFLNLYFKTSATVDNSYGANTQKAVAAFQKDQSMTSDGIAGQSTFTRMVAWLKTQG
jgi:peptidoglycan hydrolase-like protein with peptidoglycan-binding domain